MHGRLRRNTAVLGGILLGAMQICGPWAVAIVMLPLSRAVAADRVTVPFTAVDGGDITFTSQTSADLNGNGFENHGFRTRIQEALNSGQINILGPTEECEGGLKAALSGVFITPNPDDTIHYTIKIRLCQAEAGVYPATGTYQITGGTGQYANARGVGVFSGLANFNSATYTCLLFGTISY